MKKSLITVTVIAVVGISAGAYYMRRGGVEPQITTAHVTRGDIVETVGATGTLEAVTTVQVGSQVSGTVMELNADFNSIVRKGQVIARLDPSLLQTQIEQARANLARAEAEVERLRVQVDDARTKLGRAQGLAAKHLIPQSELESAEVNLRSAQAQLRSSQASLTQARATLNQNEVNLQHTVITAPIDGIVIARNVDVGQTVAASLQAPTLYVIAADLTKMKVNANIDEADVGRIRPRQQVRFRVDAYPTDEFTGTVAQVRLQPVVQQNVVTYATVIDVPNPDLKLKPGMTANVSVEIARRDNAIRVPTMALRFRPTVDTFAALGLDVPPEVQRGRGAFADGASGGAAIDASSSGNAAATAGNQSDPPPRPQPGAQAAAPGERPSASSDGNPEERRRRLMDRMQSLPPEERERMLQRFRERQRQGGADASRGGGGSDAARGAAGLSGPRAEQRAPARGTAQTIDQLFGPLPREESVGRVWLYAHKQLKPARLRLGISDGTWTELLSGDLQPGIELVTGVILQQQSGAGAGGPRSPLMGPDRRPQNMGGFRNAPGGGGSPRR